MRGRGCPASASAVGSTFKFMTQLLLERCLRRRLLQQDPASCHVTCRTVLCQGMHRRAFQSCSGCPARCHTCCTGPGMHMLCRHKLCYMPCCMPCCAGAHARAGAPPPRGGPARAARVQAAAQGGEALQAQRGAAAHEAGGAGPLQQPRVRVGGEWVCGCQINVQVRHAVNYTRG